MEKIVLRVKDQSKLGFLLELIKQFDFVEIQKGVKKKAKDGYNLFDSAGLWKNRDIDAQELRKEAWTRKS